MAAASALLLLLIALESAGCQKSRDERAPATPLLLVGLDGATWTFLDRLIELGATPNLSRLSRGGVRGTLETLRPALSPAVWTTVATGHDPSRHGITGFVSVNNEEGFVSSSDRRTEALWNILSRRGRSVGFVGWWCTWPAEDVAGYIVSDRFVRPRHEGLHDVTYPRTLAKELDAAIAEDWPWLREVLEDGRLKLLGDPAPGPQPLTARRLQLARFLYQQDHRVEQAALRLLRERPRPELFGLVSRKIDLASHYMAGFVEGELDDDAMARALEPVYRYEDGLVGRLLELAGPEASIIVVSDHGFERTGAGYDHKKSSPPGIFVAWGPLFRENVVLRSISVYDVAPTLLHALRLPVADDMKGAVITAALRDARPIERIATHETGTRRPHGHRSAQDEALREELRALGYVN